MTNHQSAHSARQEQSIILRSLLAQEPLLHALLALAALQSPDARWRSYEAIKCLASPLVGTAARCASLRSPAAYLTFMRELDAILPPEAPVTNVQSTIHKKGYQ